MYTAQPKLKLWCIFTVCGQKFRNSNNSVSCPALDWLFEGRNKKNIIFAITEFSKAQQILDFHSGFVEMQSLSYTASLDYNGNKSQLIYFVTWGNIWKLSINITFMKVEKVSCRNYFLYTKLRPFTVSLRRRKWASTHDERLVKKSQ